MEHSTIKASNAVRFQFISSSYTGKDTSAAVKRKIHSHAARTAHTRARLLSIRNYQEGKTEQTTRSLNKVDKRGSLQPPPSSELTTWNTTSTVEKQYLPSPVSVLSSDRRDPFQCFAKPFEPIEHFLLNHCKSPHYWDGECCSELLQFLHSHQTSTH